MMVPAELTTSDSGGTSEGPIPGLKSYSRRYSTPLGDPTVKPMILFVTVERGVPADQQLKRADGVPWGKPITSTIRGNQVIAVDRSATDTVLLAWAAGKSTVVWLSGVGLTQDDLVAIGNSMEVNAP